ncbi:LuxR C-terminal-related transcriptional regulator [Streptomyces sp. URMC 129]|uniref:LuxR C-terminal-related transcriptional regulator n=1 Tax=Streptomyces sp. URMC 129 TaxID=3423407 RepID=UPI003F1B86B7
MTEGRTNREVAARLSLSPRTVGHHPRGVYAAPGVRSRVELARAGHVRRRAGRAGPGAVRAGRRRAPGTPGPPGCPGGRRRWSRSTARPR